jgi:hypothetical protein
MCCSEGFFVPGGTVCDADIMQEYGCPWGTGCGNDPAVHSRDVICDGEHPDCETLGPWKEWRAVAECDDLQACGPDGTCVSGVDCSCECTSGVCCDGCHLLPLDFACAAAPAEQTQCIGGCGGTVQRREGPRRCTGASTECVDDNVVWGEWADTEVCAPDEACSVVAGEAQCEPCPRGCADGACLPCVPECGSRLCGDDGCGGSCGECPLDYYCTYGFCTYDPPPGLAGGTGCGCRAVGGSGGLATFGALSALVLLLWRRRSRVRPR